MMKKVLIISIFLSFLSPVIYAWQPTKAEIDKMVKEAQEKMEKMKNDPAVKEEMKKVQGNTSTNISLPETKSTYVLKNFPPRNTALLNTLQKKILSRPELLGFLTSLHSVLLKKLNPENVKAAQEIMTSLHNEPGRLVEASIIAWYNNAPAESVLLITYAASKSPKDNTLNNCGAILNLCGLEEKAIPILKYALQHEPTSSDLLNNLGQAYTGLGETDTAMVYFSRCFQNSPDHPEANHTAGEIENSKGNTSKAKEYLEQSLTGGYTQDCARLLHFIDPGAHIYYKYLRPHVKIPEYFNENKYKLPGQCRNVGEAEKLGKEYEAFQEMIKVMKSKYQKLKNEENKIVQQTIGTKAVIMAQNHKLPPFQKLAGMMLIELSKDYADDMKTQIQFNQEFDLNKKKFQKDYEKAMSGAMSQFKERMAKEGEGHHDPTLDADICNAGTEVNNGYLDKLAMLTLDWQTKNINTHKKYINDLIYWNYLQSIDIHEFRVRFYDIVYDYLSLLGNLCQTKFLFPCEKTEAEKKQEPEIDIKEPECPFEVDLKFFVGKLSLDCENFSFSGGEGYRFKYKVNFKSRKSTLSFGIGAGYDIEETVAGIKGSVGADVGESIYIEYDKDNNISDAGLKFRASISAGVNAFASAENERGDKIKVNKDLGSKETGIGYTMGVNSGWNFEEGPFKGILNPAETQVNKNVKLYN